MKTFHIKTISVRKFFRMLKLCYPGIVVDRARREPGGQLWASDRKVLFPAASAIGPKIILEIGTHKGETTLGLANSAPQAKVYTIDIFREMRKDISTFQRPEVLARSRVGQVFKNKKKNIVQIFGDSRDIATYPFCGKKIDLAFIDGNHSLEAVVRDSQNVLKFMKRRSIIFWHDFIKNSNSRVPVAMGYLILKERLNIFHIKNTWLAFCLLDR